MEQAILALHQGVVEVQQGGRFQYHSHLAQAFGRHQKRTYSQRQPIARGQIRRTPPRTLQDEQLVFDRQRFGRDRAKTTRPGKPCESHQEVGDQCEQQSQEGEL
jgi:hypothetical protein